jgi:hypothetical protein
VDVAEGGDTDGTDASDLETGTSRRKFEDYKLICYPWAVVEVKKAWRIPTGHRGMLLPSGKR